MFNRDPRAKDPAIELAMTVDGHRLYKYKNIGNLPLFREIVTRVAYAKMESGVRHDDLVVYTNMIDDLFDAGQFAQIAKLNGYLQQQLREFVSERISMEIGGYTVLVDDEPHMTTTDEYADLKRKLCGHRHVADFFLSEAIGLVADLNPSIDPSLMMEQLKNPLRMERERVFLSAIGLSFLDGLWTMATPPPSGWQSQLAAILQKTS